MSTQAELERRREELAGRVAELHWDLGGLAYEMAIRDHFRNDVLLARAAQLQELDTELAEVERQLGDARAHEEGPGGSAQRLGAGVATGADLCAAAGRVPRLRRRGRRGREGRQDIPSACASGADRARAGRRRERHVEHRESLAAGAKAEATPSPSAEGEAESTATTLHAAGHDDRHDAGSQPVEPLGCRGQWVLRRRTGGRG